MNACRGCGKPLPPYAGVGRHRIWCSENCCKRTHEKNSRGTCAECGAVLRAGSGYPSDPTKLCVDCAREARRTDLRRRGRLVEQWWAEGLSLAEIAAKLGISREHLGKDMFTLRDLGFDLPYRHVGRRKGSTHPELRKAA